MDNIDVCWDCRGCEWFIGGECDGRDNLCSEYEPYDIDCREGW